MEVDTFFGLPAHPLLVHIPIVLIPILGLATIALAVNKDWRERYSVAAAVVGVGTMIMTILAAGAGEKLEERVGEDSLIRDHAELGEQTRLLMIIFAVVLVAMAVSVKRGSAKAAAWLSIAALVVGGLSTAWVVRTGHAGAKSVWQGTTQGNVQSDDD